MPTVIDSLSVELGLDNTKFKKGIKDSDKIQDDFNKKTFSLGKKNIETERKGEQVKEKHHKEEKFRNKESLEGFNSLRNAALTFLAVFTAGKGIVEFVSGTITADAAINRLSDNAQMSVEDIAGFQWSLEQVGGTAEEASTAISKAATAVASFRHGMPTAETSAFINAANLAGVDWSGAFTDAKSYLLAQSKVLGALFKTDRGEAMRQAGLMGVSGNVFNLMEKGKPNLVEQMAKGAKETGTDRKQTEAAEKYEKMFKSFEARLGRIGKTLMFPVLKELMPLLNEFTTNLEHWPALIKLVKEAMMSIVDTFGDVVHLMTLLHALPDIVSGKKKPVAGIETATNSQITAAWQSSFDVLRSKMAPNANHQLYNDTTTNNSKPTINIYTQDDPKKIVQAIDNWWGTVHQANSAAN